MQPASPPSEAVPKGHGEHIDRLLPLVHVYPASTVHEEEHPSPGTVLPSSHTSLSPTRPSPHTATQDEEVVDPGEENVAGGQEVQVEEPANE